MLAQAFCPQSTTFLVTTNGTTLTANAQVVSFNPTIALQAAAQATGLSFMPECVQVVNQGASGVWISFTSALRVATVPAANPSQEIWVQPNNLPGSRVVMRLGGLWGVANAASAVAYCLQINTISVGLSIPLSITFGEGQ